MVPTIPCRELFLRLFDEEVLVVDCRDEDGWGRPDLKIPGAMKVPLEELAEVSRVLPDDELIVLCGLSPDGSDASRAYRLLKARGRQSVCLDGGLYAWVSEGYPTERSQERGAGQGHGSLPP